MILAIGVIGIGAAFALGSRPDAVPDHVLAEKKETVLPGGPQKAPPPVEVMLASNKKEYRSGEEVNLILTIKNNDKAEFSYPDFKFRELREFTVIGPPDGKEVTPVQNPAEISFVVKTIRVRPGEAVAVKDVLQGINLSKVPGKDHYRRHTY